MVALEVHVQKLFLPECFLTLAAGKWLLPSVCALMHYHVALLEKQNKLIIYTIMQHENKDTQTFIFNWTHLSAAVVALFTLETFLILVSLLVLDESVSLMKHGITVTTFLSRLNK